MRMAVGVRIRHRVGPALYVAEMFRAESRIVFASGAAGGECVHVSREDSGSGGDCSRHGCVRDGSGYSHVAEKTRAEAETALTSGVCGVAGTGSFFAGKGRRLTSSTPGYVDMISTPVSERS